METKNLIEKNRDQNPKSRQNLVLRLRFSSFMTMIILTFAAISVSYICGVMSGRNDIIQSRNFNRNSLNNVDIDKISEKSRLDSKDELSDKKILSSIDLEFSDILKDKKIYDKKDHEDQKILLELKKQSTSK